MDFLKGLLGITPARTERPVSGGLEHNVIKRPAAIADPDDMLKRLRNLVRTNPRKFLERWESLWEEDKIKAWYRRGHGPPQPALTNPEFLKMTQILSDIAQHVLPRIQVFSESESPDTDFSEWEALFLTGLHPFCAKIAQDIHLFLEAPIWVLRMMKLFDAVISYSRRLSPHTQDIPIPLDHVTSMLADLVLEHCRRRMDLLEDGNPIDQATPGMARELRVSWRSIMTSEQLRRRRNGGASSSELPCAPDLLLMCWFRQDDPWNHQFKQLNYMAFSPVFDQPEKLAELVESEIIEKYGAEAYLLRLCAALQDPSLGDGPLVSLLSIHRKVLLNEAFNPHFNSTGITRALCQILERENDREYPSAHDHNTIAVSALKILKWITDGLPVDDGAAVLIRDHDIFRLISSCMHTVSRTLATAEGCAIYALCSSFERVGQDLALHPRKDPLRKEYKRALRQEWIPLLDFLDQLPRPVQGSLDSQDTDVVDLSRRIWKKTGCVGAGFTEKGAREWYKTREGKFCSWEDCRWHVVEPPNPAKRCTGCKQARYCSKRCQSCDWKSGHRLSCCPV